MPLIKEGIIKDPVVADYCYSSEWVEEKSWWFRKEFTLTDSELRADNIRLVFESLDYRADIFVNGKHIGSHANCHVPFEAELADLSLVNILDVKLTVGNELVSDEEAKEYVPLVCTEKALGRGDRGWEGRVFLRKPQYVYGWDWAPRAASCGIMKDAYLLINNDYHVNHIHPVTNEISGDKASLNVAVEFESFSIMSTKDAEVILDVQFEGKTVASLAKEVMTLPGVNYLDFCIEITNPKLWWPGGAGLDVSKSENHGFENCSPMRPGEQPLYTAVVKINGSHTKAVDFGIRTVALDFDKFQFVVNGEGVFMKGANWIPSDSIYARVTPDKYETLIKDAVSCNFNTLRVWGGGLYEPDIFYNLCDKYGLMVWHDFMFACALYPEKVIEDVKKEAAYQVKRLRHHPCLTMWCGNNEIHWLYPNATAAQLKIFNYVLPEIVRLHCPEIPYWPSSPFGGAAPNGPDIGNRHFWSEGTMNQEMINRITPEIYDAVDTPFVSEYGYIGPCSETTIQKYFGSEDVDRTGSIWSLHNNTFEKETVPAGINKHYADVDKLSNSEYLEYARLVQGLMYQYSLESIRFHKPSTGSLFWMYNDAWGEVGWSIIDYYLDRKPSYYYVKRAFAPVKLILRSKNSEVTVLAANDTAETIETEIEYGFVDFDGNFTTAKKTVVLKPFTKTDFLTFKKIDDKNGIVFARCKEAPTAILRTSDFRAIPKRVSKVEIVNTEVDGNDLLITLRSTGFNHAVNILPYANLSDNYFDMLPGEIYTVTAYNAANNSSPSDIVVKHL